MATATFTTVVARAIGDPLTQPIWQDQIQDNVNQLAGSHRQLLVNGGFEPQCWQRGAGPFTANGAYTADRWLLTIASGTATVTQETSIVDTGSGASLKIVTVGTVNQNISQKIEDLAQLRGRTISLSVRVRQSVASAVIARISAAGGSADAATSATTGAFVTLSVSMAVGAADAGPLQIQFIFSAAGTFYLDNAMLVIGPAPAPYQPLHPQEDLARCERYYEVHGGITGAFIVIGYGAAGANNGNYISFHTKKGGLPTVTKNGTWSVTNCGQPATSFIDTNGYAISATVTALGSYNFSCNSSDDNTVSEYNP